MGGTLKKVFSAITKIVKVIVKIVKFIIKAIVNFVKGVLSGDIGSIIMLIVIIFTWGAALGFWFAAWEITAGSAMVSTAFAICASEFQKQKADKMKAAAEADLDRQADSEERRLTKELIAQNEQHFSQMEQDRYNGYVSGQFGIGSFEPDGTFQDDKPAANTPKTESSLGSSLYIAAAAVALTYLASTS